MTHLDDDLSIPPEIEARLRSVDGVLPPTPAWHAPSDEAGLLRVVPVRRASRGPSVAAVLAAVAVLIGSAVLIGRPSAPGPAASGSPSSAVVLALPHGSPVPPGACRLGRSGGALAGSPTDPQVAWVLNSGVRLDIVWPAGYQARFAATLELLDGAGAVVARAGDTLEFAGGIGAEGDAWFACGITVTARGSDAVSPSMPSLEPSSPPGAPAVEVLRGRGDGENLIVPRFGCDDGVGVDALMARLYEGADVDRAAVAAGIDNGWLDVPVEGRDPARVWLGEDVVALAIGAGSPLVAVGERGMVWLTEGRRANQWSPMVTPAGRTAWRTGSSAMAPAESCPSASAGPAPVLGIRSFACGSIDHDACASAIAEARQLAPEAFTADASVVVAAACGPSMRCAAPPRGSVPAMIVVAVAQRWRSLADLRVFTVGGADPPAGAMETVMGDLPAHVLALVSRPSLPLPVSTPPSGVGEQSCPSARLEGGLTGSPWDPWGARVGSTPILWPAGFSARFVPDLEIMGPDGDVVAREGDLMVIGGGFESEESDRFRACFVNGTVYPGR